MDDDDVTLLFLLAVFPSAKAPPPALLPRRFRKRFVTRLLLAFSPLIPLVNNSFSFGWRVREKMESNRHYYRRVWVVSRRNDISEDALFFFLYLLLRICLGTGTPQL